MATKAPWPTVDGGRLLLWNSLKALREAEVEVVLVAPVPVSIPGRSDGAGRSEVIATLSRVCEPHLVPIGEETKLRSALLAFGRPLTIARHTHPAVRRQVEELLSSRTFSAVHAEQLQALPQTFGARALGLPIVLRAQNVESDLWRLWAGHGGGLQGGLLRLESRRLAAWEGEGVARSAQTWALSREDGFRLNDLAQGQGEVIVVPPPFAPLLQRSHKIEGEPPVVVMGSRGWRPNEDAVAWFAEVVWPRVLGEEPGAILHIFGAREGTTPTGPGVRFHPPPREAAEAFPAESILVVPLRVGSGVRIKILEAWARGVAVVGTPQAFAGLEVDSGREGVVACDAAEFARAISALHRNPDQRRALIDRAGERLRKRHAPAIVGRQMAAAYADLAAKSGRIRTRR